MNQSTPHPSEVLDHFSTAVANVQALDAERFEAAQTAHLQVVLDWIWGDTPGPDAATERRRAAEHLASLPAERRAQLEAEWPGDARVAAIMGERM